MNPSDDGENGEALFPTGNLVDVLDVPGVGTFAATLINAGIPTVFVNACDIGLQGTELREDINNDPVQLARLEQIRVAGALRMGLVKMPEEALKRQHTPKLAFVSPPRTYTASNGKRIEASDVDLLVRALSMAWSGSVRAETTQQAHSASGNIHQANFFLGGPIKDEVLGLQIYGQKAHRSEDRFLNGFNKQDTASGTAKLSLSPNKDHDLVLEISRTLQDRISTPGKTMALETCTRDVCAPNSVSESNYNKTLYALSHTGRWAVGTSNTYVQQEEIDNPGRSMNIKNTEFNSQITMPLADGRHLTTVGVSYKNEKLNDMGNQLVTANPISTLERYQWALFAENEWSMSDRFALTAGLRMNEDENYGRHWTPRLYGVWKATEMLSVKGGISTGFKAPNLRAAVAEWGQITGGGGDPAIIIGNPNLKPEKSISQEIGVVWDNRRDLNASLTLFNTDFKDKITEMRSCTDTASSGSSITTGNCVINGTAYKFISDRVNVDKANMRGIEATATWSVSPELRLATNCTYTRSQQKSGAFKGQPLNKMPKHMLNATVDWQATNHLGVWGRLNFRGKTSEYLNRTSMVQGTPSFAFVDVGLNYVLTKQVRLGAGIYNLLDKNVDHTTCGAEYDRRRYWINVTASF